MDFLIDAILNTLKSYGYKMEYEKQEDGTYIVRLYNLPAALEVKLINLTYSELIDYEHKIVNGQETDNPVYANRSICFPSKDEHDTRYITIVLDKDNYATKMNLVDANIKEYRRNSRKYEF